MKIKTEDCTGCGGCIDLCPSIAISMVNNKAVIDSALCTECKICEQVCPVNAPCEV